MVQVSKTVSVQPVILDDLDQLALIHRFAVIIDCSVVIVVADLAQGQFQHLFLRQFAPMQVFYQLRIVIVELLSLKRNVDGDLLQLGQEFAHLLNRY